MFGLIFNLSNGQPIMPLGERLGVDANGNFKLRVGRGISVDLSTGETLFTTPWDTDDGRSDDER